MSRAEHAPRRRPSRWMPPATDRTISPRAFRIGCAVASAAVLVILYHSVTFRIVAAFLVAVFTVGSMVHGRRMRRLAAERRGEGICTFARSLDRRAVDPWVVRAVYDQLQPYAAYGDVLVPIRPADTLETLGIDGDELDDVARDIAERTGRTLDGGDRNPVRRVRTVGDLVRFFSHQPRTAS